MKIDRVNLVFPSVGCSFDTGLQCLSHPVSMKRGFCDYVSSYIMAYET